MSNPFRYFNSSPEVIRLVVMMYVRYPLSLRNVEDLLAERGIDISHETVRFWWNRFGPMFAAEIRKRRVAHMRGYPQWRWHLDEVFVKVNGKLCWHCHGSPGLRRSRWPGSHTRMNKISYSGYRFPPEMIQQADMVLPPVHPQPARRRRFIGGARSGGVLRDGSALGESFRTDDRGQFIDDDFPS